VTRLDDLIAELCPDGVEFRQLAEVTAYSDTRVDAAELDGTTFVGVDNLLPNKGGKVDASYLPNAARVTAYEADDVLLGNIRPYLKKVWLATSRGGCSGDVLALRVSPPFRTRLLPRFLYYVISSDHFFAYATQHAKGGKMPRGSKAAILRYRLPIPPVAVQREVLGTRPFHLARGGAESGARRA
jgi:type I restriction enzyme, S subunit